MSGGIGGGTSEGFDLDTKGQIHGYDTAQAAIDVGSNNQIIYADSAQAAGIGYGASAKSTLATTGSLLAASSANTLSELSAGATSGHVLTSTGAASLPTYQAVAAGGAVELLDYENFSVAANSYTKTFSPALTEADYSQFMIAISAKSDATAAQPYIIFSGSASNVYSTGFYNNRTTSVVESISAVAPMLLMNATGLPSGNTNFTSLLTFTIHNSMGYITGKMETLNGNSVHTVENMWEVSASNLSSIEIGMTGIGEMVAASQFAVWGYKNA